MASKLVMVGLYAEMLKFGRKPDPTKPTLDHQLTLSGALAAAKGHNLTEIGYDLTFGEARALFAVQSLLHDTSYKGNQPPQRLSGNTGYRFTGDLPWLIVPISDYLEAYGVSKRKTNRRKWEYSSEGRKSALKALDALANRQMIHAYDRKTRRGKRMFVERIEAVNPLVRCVVGDGTLSITPSPVLVDSITKRFIWVPKDLYASKGIGRDRAKVLFFEYLCYQFTMNQKKAKGKKVCRITLAMESVAYALRMGALLEARQGGRVRRRLNALYDYAKKAGYLKTFKVDAPGKKVDRVDILGLNVSKFQAMRKVQTQVSQGLPATVAKSTSTVSSDPDPDEENQEDS